MKKNKTANKLNTSPAQDEIIQSALRTGGFLFPESVAEVEIFDRNFGTTEISLPEDLQQPLFLMNKTTDKMSEKISNIQRENLAMAARNETGKLPEDILKRMESDRHRSTSKTNKRKPKEK